MEENCFAAVPKLEYGNFVQQVLQIQEQVAHYLSCLQIWKPCNWSSQGTRSLSLFWTVGLALILYCTRSHSFLE